MSAETKMPQRKLGADGPLVPAYGLGSWNTWDRMEFDDAVGILRRSVDAGVNFFDVAHYNMGPHAEQSTTDLIFGKAIREAGIAREDYLLCGKLWLWEYPAAGFAAQLNESLDRVGVDKADLVVVGDYMERPDVRAIVTEVAEQVRAGRFDAWGVNNWIAADLHQAIDFARTEGLPVPCFAQLKYSVVRRTMAEGPFYQELFDSGSFAMQASDILEGGILAGKLRPQRKIGADPGGIRGEIREAAAELAEIAGSFNSTAPQLALAFCLANPAVANVLFGVSRREQLEDNLAALELYHRHGSAIREAVQHLWADRNKVQADGSWL